MNLKNINIDKKIKRKNFFKAVGVGVAGFWALKSMPFKLLSKNNKELQNIENTRNSRVKINPLAVSRKKIGGSNV